jgi:WD40 repeat protein
MRTWAAHSNAIRGLAFSPDGSRFVTIADGDSAAIVWDRFGPAEPLRLSLFQERALSVAFTPDGQSVAIGRHSAVELWSAADNERFARMDSLRHRSNSLAFSRDGQTLLSAGERRGDSMPGYLHAVIWNLRTGRATCDLGRLTSEYRGYSFAIDAARFLWSHGSADTNCETIATLTDVRTRVDLAVLLSPGPLLAGALSPDGRVFAGAVKSRVCLWSVGIALGSEPPNPAWLSAQELRRLDGREKDAPAMSASTGFIGSNERIDALAFTPDSRRLLAGSAVGTIHVWDMPDRPDDDAFAVEPIWFEQPVARFDWQFGPITTLAVAPDGLTAAAGGMDGRVLVWDLDS